MLREIVNLRIYSTGRFSYDHHHKNNNCELAESPLMYRVGCSLAL